jgi:hypothetical protein
MDDNATWPESSIIYVGKVFKEIYLLEFTILTSSQSSTHNTRIERLWVEVGRNFCRYWRAFFMRLERLHHLDRRNPHHLWLLHTLFLQDINDDCQQFIEEWNAHPLSGSDTNNSSPNVSFLTVFLFCTKLF